MYSKTIIDRSRTSLFFLFSYRSKQNTILIILHVRDKFKSIQFSIFISARRTRLKPYVIITCRTSTTAAARVKIVIATVSRPPKSDKSIETTIGGDGGGLVSAAVDRGGRVGGRPVAFEFCKSCTYRTTIVIIIIKYNIIVASTCDNLPRKYRETRPGPDG